MRTLFDKESLAGTIVRERSFFEPTGERSLE
jgi:hypothetical protein